MSGEGVGSAGQGEFEGLIALEGWIGDDVFGHGLAVGGAFAFGEPDEADEEMFFRFLEGPAEGAAQGFAGEKAGEVLMKGEFEGGHGSAEGSGDGLGQNGEGEGLFEVGPEGDVAVGADTPDDFVVESVEGMGEVVGDFELEGAGGEAAGVGGVEEGLAEEDAFVGVGGAVFAGPGAVGDVFEGFEGDGERLKAVGGAGEVPVKGDGVAGVREGGGEAEVEAGVEGGEEGVEEAEDDADADKEEGDEEDGEKVIGAAGLPGLDDFEEENGDDAVPEEGNEESAEDFGEGAGIGFEAEGAGRVFRGECGEDVVLDGAGGGGAGVEGPDAGDDDAGADYEEQESEAEEGEIDPFKFRVDDGFGGIVGVDKSLEGVTGRVGADDVIFTVVAAGGAGGEVIAVGGVLPVFDAVGEGDVDAVGGAVGSPVGADAAGEDGGGNLGPGAGILDLEEGADAEEKGDGDAGEGEEEAEGDEAAAGEFFGGGAGAFAAVGDADGHGGRRVSGGL